MSTTTVELGHSERAALVSAMGLAEEIGDQLTSAIDALVTARRLERRLTEHLEGIESLPTLIGSQDYKDVTQARELLARGVSNIDEFLLRDDGVNNALTIHGLLEREVNLNA